MDIVKLMIGGGVCLVLAACGTSNGLPLQRGTIDFDREMRSHNYSNESECLKNIFINHNRSDTNTIKFSGKDYYFDNTIRLEGLNGNWVMAGEQNTRILLSSTMAIIQGAAFKIDVDQFILRHAKSVRVNNEYNNISLLRITSNEVVETAWKYTAGDLVGVESSQNGMLELQDSLNFEYAPENSIMIGYQHCSIGLKGIQFIYTGAVGHMMTFTGLSLNIEDCSFTYNGIAQIPAFITVYNCNPVRLQRVKITGMVDYGFLINGSRNIFCEDIVAAKCIHPIVPATWTTNVNVKRLHCTECVIDAHPSFNVSYRDITIEDGQGYWNCRALGVKLENCQFRTDERTKDKSLYLGMLGLTDKYAFLYDEYDVQCINVNWLHADYGFNGLHVHKCRDFIVDGCTTHAVSTGDKIRNFKVTNSTIGRLYCSDSNFQVINTVFNADLQSRVIPIPPLSCSYDGTMIIDDCAFLGYDSTYLFRYIQSGNTALHMTNTYLASIRGFALTTYLPSETYTQLKLDSNRIGAGVREVFRRFTGIKYTNGENE